MTGTNKDNPFYSNHIFSEFDLQRIKISHWKHPLLWFKPTYVQFNDGYEYYYKIDGQGRYYLMDVKPFKGESI